MRSIVQLSSARSTLAVAKVARLAMPMAPAAAVLFALALAGVAGALAASRGFDGLYGQDAYAYFDYSTTSVRQSLQHLQPLPAFFWPPGYPVLVALASFVVGPTPLAGQLVSLLMGALVPLFTVLLARELWPEDELTAVLAGAVAAVAGQLWQSSIVVMSDTAGLALATFSAWALVRYVRRGAIGWLVAASAALAVATLSRWIYGLVGLPFGVYALLQLIGTKRPLAAPVVVGMGVFALIVGPIVGPSLVGLISHPATPAAFAGNFQVYSWSPLNALRRDFFTADGHLKYTQPNGLYYAIAPANLAYFGPVLAAFALVGVWRARRWPLPLIVLVVGWAAIVYVFHAGAPWQNFRFALAYLPPLAILVAAGLGYVRHLRDVRLRAFVAVCALGGLLTTSADAVRLVEGFIDRKTDELALVHWIQSAAPADAQLFSFGPTLAFRQYSSFPTTDLYDVNPTDIGALLSKPSPAYVLLDESSVESQWLDQAPSNNFHFLRDGPGLTLVGSQQGYTLYRVGHGT